MSITTSEIRTHRIEDRALVDSINEAVLHQGRALDIVYQEIRHFTEQSNVLQVHSSIDLDNKTSQSMFNSTDMNVLNLICISGDVSHTRSTNNIAFPSSFTFHMTKHQRCKALCVCVCHRQGCLKSPRWLGNMLGSLFFGYTGLPQYLNRCNVKTCQRSSSTALYVQYIFPSWLMRCILLTKIAFSQNKGPELLLRCLRIRPGDARIFDAAATLQTDHIRQMLTSGEASVLDVNDRGRSPLHVGL